MTIRDLRSNDVTFSLFVEQDDTPVRGNALASGDDAEDRAAEDEILSRLDDGDVWAWACVTVRAEWRGHTAHASLGRCNYGSEDDFRADPYFDSLRAEALDALNARLSDISEDLARLAD